MDLIWNRKLLSVVLTVSLEFSFQYEYPITFNVCLGKSKLSIIKFSHDLFKKELPVLLFFVNMIFYVCGVKWCRELSTYIHNIKTFETNLIQKEYQFHNLSLFIR